MKHTWILVFSGHLILICTSAPIWQDQEIMGDYKEQHHCYSYVTFTLQRTHPLQVPLCHPRLTATTSHHSFKNLKQTIGLLTPEDTELFLVFESKVGDSLHFVRGRKPYYFLSICALSIFYYSILQTNLFKSWLSQVVIIWPLQLLKLLNTLLKTQNKQKKKDKIKTRWFSATPHATDIKIKRPFLKSLLFDLCPSSSVWLFLM